MKTAAIIAEYNPFHKGHRYQIEETRKATGADYILVLMSGDFVQRGEPAIYNKYIRTRMALLGGADAVLELPVLYATSSAEFFAEGAVTLLDHMQMVDFLSFGSESGKLEDFLPLAELLNRKEATVLSTVNELLRQGLSYPKARSRAVSLLFPEYSSADAAFFSSPNNILALEYCKTLKKLKSSIKPFTLLRKGSGYHDPFLPEDSSVYPSASALRSLITASTSSQFLTADDLSPQLFYKLLTEKDCGFSDYLDCSTALSDRICKYLSSFTGYTDFCTLLKSREFTYTRISRTLLHILLNQKTPVSFKPSFSERHLKTPYVRLLGFRKASAALLSSIKKHSDIPLVSKLADAKTILSEDAYQMLSGDIMASTLYESATFLKYASTDFHQKTAANNDPSCFAEVKKGLLNEYQQSPIIL